MEPGTPPDSIPIVSVNTDTGRVKATGTADPVQDAPVFEVARRYLAKATALVGGLDGAIHVAYDPKLVALAGSAPRFLAIASLDRQFAEVLSTATGRDVAGSDLILVMGPGFVYYEMDDPRMTEIVAGDLTTAFHRLHPVRCQGPIAQIMPWLVQIAGNILIPGWTEAGDGDISPLAERRDKAIGRAIRSFVEQNYRDHVNPEGQAVTDFPALSPVAEIVGNEACFFVSRSGGTPLTRQTTVSSIHEVISRAMRDAGVSVVRDTKASFG